MTPCPKPPPKPKAKPHPIARRTALKRGPSPARRVRPRQMRKGKTAAQEREARVLASKITLARCSYCCECERQPCLWRATDAAHGLSKGAHPAVEFELDNLIGLSRRCHERLRSARMDGCGAMSELMLARKGWRWAGVLALSLKPRPPIEDVLYWLRTVAQHMGIVRQARIV